MLLASADNQIALPVAESFALADDSWTLVDRDLIGDGGTPLTATAITFPAGLLAAQGVAQSAARPLVGVDTLVDAFVADGRQVVGSDVTGNLLGTPCLGKLGVDKGPSFGGNATPILPGLLPTMCEFVRLLGAVATLTPIPRHLPADGRFVTVHHSGNVASVMSGFGKDGNLVPFVLGDVCICHFRQL